jgi:hypothetical protein
MATVADANAQGIYERGRGSHQYRIEHLNISSDWRPTAGDSACFTPATSRRDIRAESPTDMRGIRSPPSGWTQGFGRRT